jgi:serine/threonine-protein kinase HipA
MKRLDIYFSGWSEDWLLGSLADTGETVLFEYSREALDQGLELSPLNLRLRPQAFDRFPSHLYRLPGLLADSLPDGWGLMLMDRLFRQRGLRNASPLDRLAFIGDRAMGALRFVPADSSEQVVDWGLKELAVQTTLLVDENPKAALRELAFLGGSPQGARPKALVQFDINSNRVSTVAGAPGEPWLIKFPAQGEHKEVCALEQLYAELARDCGLDVSPSQWFDINDDMAAFGTQRFDRIDGKRMACHSLAGLLHADFRVPGSVDYTAFLRATRVLTRDEKEVEKAFARAVFNVLFHNRDDHPKNFSWRLGEDRRWRLAPAFDLTFTDGPMGQHHMDVCGQAQHIGRDHLLALAKEGGVSGAHAKKTIERMLEQVPGFKARAQAFAIRKATVDQVANVIDACATLIRGV